jgi:cytidylate kinase
MENYVIAITKQFGTFGSAIGETVAKTLGIPVYDRASLEKEAASLDDTLTSLVDFSEHGVKDYYKMAYPLGVGSSLKQDRMFELQSKLVLGHAERESCVIIGRCADYLLRERENVIRCYIFAPYQARIRGSIQILGSTAEPQRIIEEIDKARANYYRTRTGCEVNNTRYRDLFLNSNLLGVEGTADLIVHAARKKFHLSDCPATEKE